MRTTILIIRKSASFAKRAITLAGLTGCVLLILLSICCENVLSQWRELHLPTRNLTDFGCIYFRSDNPQIGFISDDYNYRTTDGGYTWTSLTLPITQDSFTFAAEVNDFAFKDSNTGWASAGYLFQTTDGGGTWNKMNIPSLGGAMDVYYDKKYDRLLVADYSIGVQESTDNGANWNVSLDARHPLDDGNMGQALSFWNDDTGVVATYYGFYLTEDGGTTWRQVSDVGDHINQLVSIPGTTTGFAIDVFGVVRRTDDLWQTWRDVYRFPKEYDPFLSTMIGTIPNIVGDLQNLFVWRDSTCFRSTDQGVTWKSLCGVKSDIGFDSYYCRYYADDHRVLAPEIDYYTGQHFWMLNLDSMQYFQTGVVSSEGSKQISVPAGAQITVNYSPQTTDPIGIDTGHLVFHYDNASLALTDLKLPPSWRILDSSSANGTIILTFTSDSSDAIQNPLVRLTFNTLLSPSSGSLAWVYLDSTYLSGHRLNCDCQALSTGAPDSVTIHFTGCGDSLLEAEMNQEPPFSIENVVPNPATASLRVEGSGQGVEAQLFDDLGHSVILPTFYSLPFTLDVSQLPSGIYFLRLNSGGYSVSRSVAIEK